MTTTTAKCGCVYQIEGNAVKGYTACETCLRREAEDRAYLDGCTPEQLDLMRGLHELVIASEHKLIKEAIVGPVLWKLERLGLVDSVRQKVIEYLNGELERNVLSDEASYVEGYRDALTDIRRHVVEDLQ
jgi:hypothetical protein